MIQFIKKLWKSLTGAPLEAEEAIDYKMETGADISEAKKADKKGESNG